MPKKYKRNKRSATKLFLRLDRMEENIIKEIRKVDDSVDILAAQKARELEAERNARSKEQPADESM